MISADKDALICDLAETYGIFNMEGLPVSLLATLSVGLRDDSRIKMKISGAKAPRLEILLAAAVDRLSLLLWSRTEDGRNGANKPVSMVGLILGEQKEEKDITAFDSPDDFMAAWSKITGGDNIV